MKKGLFTSLILMLTMAVTACGQAPGPAVQPQDTKAETTAPATPAAAEAGSFKIITTAGGYPFNATNVQTKEVEGFMIDIINELAKRTNMKTELVTGEWNALIPSLQSGKADVIVDGMYITEERKKVINFTEPVFAYGEGLVVQESDTTTKSLDDLKGKTIGVQLGTSFKDMLEEKNKELGMEIKTYQTLADMLRDIQNGRLDAALGDSPAFGYMLTVNPNMKFRVVKEYEHSLGGQIGIGVTKNRPELVEALNGAVKEIKEDGTLKAIYEKWGVDWDFN